MVMPPDSQLDRLWTQLPVILLSGDNSGHWQVVCTALSSQL